MSLNDVVEKKYLLLTLNAPWRSFSIVFRFRRLEIIRFHPQFE